MVLTDWLVVGVYCLITILIGWYFSKRASQSTESYFASSRSLGWLLAGTSMVATTFSSDTPLLITGMVRRKGIWGNWEWWALGVSTMMAVFIFSRLWKRSGVLTEVALTELRYSGKSAAVLRGFKALYWGVFYNCYVLGAWPMTGLAKVMQEITGWEKAPAVLFCMGVTVIYGVSSGYWGLVAADFFQFILMMAGAIILAIYSVNAVGGLSGIFENIDPSKLTIVPPAGDGTWLASPIGWLFALLTVQWWAWKNSDGGGMLVQRIASSKNERQAIFGTLWYNIAHYAIRSWPWILTALASIILIPNSDLELANGFIDHERAYPKLIVELLPAGLRGLMVASFFAAFMSTADAHLNWGSSYVVHDLYKRFLYPNASEKHYVWISRISALWMAVAATIVSFYTDSIGQAFTFILQFTAGIGPVYLARWFWWRINPASEMGAMVASVPAILLRSKIMAFLGFPQTPLFDLLYMVILPALVWIPCTFLTASTSEEKLKEFYDRVRPPGPGWRRIQKAAGTMTAEEIIEEKHFWKENLKLWAAGVVALYSLVFSIGWFFTGPLILAISGMALSAITWYYVAIHLKKVTPTEE